MAYNSIIEGIEQLRKQYPTEDDQKMLSGWEKSAKKASLMVSLRDHDGFKIIIDAYQKELAELSKTLGEEEALFKDPEGMILGRLIHERKKFITKFLRIFDIAEKVVASFEGRVDEALKEDNQ